jgi:predicted alpha/beta-hydrolase family hydrolase
MAQRQQQREEAAAPPRGDGTVVLTLPAVGNAEAKTKEVPVALQLPPGVAAGASHALCVLLCPAASGRLDDGLFPALASALAAAGVPSLRYACPGPSLSHRIAVTAALLRAAASGGSGVVGIGDVAKWVAIGSSMGCRVVCALLAPNVPRLLAAGALLSYPLVEPKSLESREAALVAVTAPLLLVRGTRDKYTPQEAWDAALTRLRSEQHTVHEVDGGDHSLKAPGGKAADAAARGGVLDAVVAFVRAQQQQQQQQHAGGGGEEDEAEAGASKRRKQR